MGGELGNETYIDVLESALSANFHLDRERHFLYEFSVEKLVLLSFRGNLGKIESEKTKLWNFSCTFFCECAALCQGQISNHGPKHDQVCEIPIPLDVGPAPPASFQSHWSSARPGPWDSQNIFAVSSCCVSSSSRFRGSNVFVSPGPAASLGSRPLSTIGIWSRVCHAPIPAFAYRWCGVRYVVPWSGIYRATTKCLESWFFFQREKLKEKRVVNRDKKITIHGKKITNRDFFLR